MAKSAKHKKLRKQEKAKTQLKGRLGKAQNVIEPKLQSKKILLREQLKTAVEGEASTKRKQTLQDVLSSLNHHNTNIKTEALGGLYELITGQDDVLAHNLGRILDKIATLTSDLERAVRTENLRVAEALLARVSEDQLQPFWNILLSHLKCSLTNINPSIRQHCLAFITLLVSHCPNLVVTSKNIILPSVLNLISSTTTVSSTSKSTSVSSSSSSTAKSQSTTKTRLKVDISDNSSQINERIHVLSLIASCLDLQTEPLSSDTSSSSFSTLYCQEKIISATNTTTTTTNSPIGQVGESFHMGLYYPFGYEDETCRKNTSMSSSLDFDMNGLINDKQNENSISFLKESEGFLPKFIHSCLPILCETWVEVAPSNKLTTTKSKSDGKSKRKGQEEVREESQNNASHLSKTAVEVLECIVNVMDHLVQRRKCRLEHQRSSRQEFNHQDSTRGIQEITASDKSQDDSANQILIRELRKSYGQDLQKYFFSFLPFSCVHESQKESMVTINLQLFNVAAQLKLVDLDKYEKYIYGLMKKGIGMKQTALVLETMSVIRVPRIGMLTTKFMIFALQSGPEFQSVVYDFLENILSLQENSTDATKFNDSMDWNSLVPVLAFLLKVKKFQPSLITVLTLVAIKKHYNLQQLLQENVQHIMGSVQSSKTKEKENSDLVLRLFYFADCLKYLDNLEFKSEKSKVSFTSSMQVLVH